MDTRTLGDLVDTKVKRYMEDNDCNYAEGLHAVLDENPPGAPVNTPADTLEVLRGSWGISNAGSRSGR
jgi:hypothetical protein